MQRLERLLLDEKGDLQELEDRLVVMQVTMGSASAVYIKVPTLSAQLEGRVGQTPL